MGQDPDDMVLLTSARSEVHAGLLTSILSSHGVPAFSPFAAASTLRWEVGATDPFRVFVRRGDLQRAKDILSQERAGSVDLDWSQVDVGSEPPSPSPPRNPGDQGILGVAIWIVGFAVLGLILFLATFGSIGWG